MTDIHTISDRKGDEERVNIYLPSSHVLASNFYAVSDGARHTCIPPSSGRKTGTQWLPNPVTGVSHTLVGSAYRQPTNPYEQRSDYAPHLGTVQAGQAHSSPGSDQRWVLLPQKRVARTCRAQYKEHHHPKVLSALAAALPQTTPAGPGFYHKH